MSDELTRAELLTRLRLHQANQSRLPKISSLSDDLRHAIDMLERDEQNAKLRKWIRENFEHDCVGRVTAEPWEDLAEGCIMFAIRKLEAERDAAQERVRELKTAEGTSD